MQMLSSFFYYTVFACSAFLYGIGSSRVLQSGFSPRKFFNSFLKLILAANAASALSFVILKGVLISVDLVELYPFVAILIYASISIFIESVSKITSKNSVSEYALGLLSVFIGVNESVSILECVLITCYCIISFAVCVFAVAFIRKKFNNKLEIVIISIAAILFIMLFWNSSWFVQGAYLK